MRPVEFQNQGFAANRAGFHLSSAEETPSSGPGVQVSIPAGPGGQARARGIGVESKKQIKGRNVKRSAAAITGDTAVIGTEAGAAAGVEQTKLLPRGASPSLPDLLVLILQLVKLPVNSPQ